MKLGVALPLIDSDVGGSPAAIQEFAQTAEETGYRDVSAPDHVLGVNVASRPDWGDRNTPAVVSRSVRIVWLLAGVTKKVEFSTKILVLA